MLVFSEPVVYCTGSIPKHRAQIDLSGISAEIQENSFFSPKTGWFGLTIRYFFHL